MSKIDLVFTILGVFCYVSIYLQFRDQRGRVEMYEQAQQKKLRYASFMQEQKRREAAAKLAEEKKRRRKADFDNMASTVERLSNISDQEVMRKSKITSGKF
ncbi:MAG: hypothetical protein LBV09_02660 [Deferribacteraceae bacterium]|jgi:hypothetical protein|nr:hypothetical protein [Deferribacteraceae bacterium]